MNMVATRLKEQCFKTIGESLDDRASLETTRHAWQLKETIDQQLKEKEK